MIAEPPPLDSPPAKSGPGASEQDHDHDHGFAPPFLPHWIQEVVKPGERVPVDGIITAGESSIDQSAITGESVPVERKPGDEVFAGTINQDNALDVRMTRLARDNTLARVMQLVAEAQEQKSPKQIANPGIPAPSAATK